MNGAALSNTLKYALSGAVLVLAGILLRVYGGDTDLGPINLRVTANVLWILGGLELLASLGSLLFGKRITARRR